MRSPISRHDIPNCRAWRRRGRSRWPRTWATSTWKIERDARLAFQDMSLLFYPCATRISCQFRSSYYGFCHSPVRQSFNRGLTFSWGSVLLQSRNLCLSKWLLIALRARHDLRADPPHLLQISKPRNRYRISWGLRFVFFMKKDLEDPINLSYEQPRPQTHHRCFLASNVSI